ncbi:G1/S-specific cyclin-D2 [Dermacentor silvarum]|uniref:G1/S-specific cyclin-D2 n=1 Tax=Dermacentor silvarum TaxID=543639 RepID=UPI00189C3AFB|nr:G1/S-specific cyclin-D2 [Dermacentor silvarum]
MEDVVDLMCMEAPQLGQTPRASHDSAIVGDAVVMARLLGLQDRYAVTCDYCRRVQTEVQTPMRKTLALWMSEVCEEQGCEDSVFPTAMNLLDRYLSLVSVRKLHLQLLGCVCLLLASKLRQTRALAVDALVYYTDCSVTAQEIQAWELQVLNRLNWDVASVVANDFVDHLVAMLGLADRGDTVRRHANTFISLCATEYHFVGYTPALLAASSVAAAVHGLRTPLHTTEAQDELMSSLERITNVRTVEIRRCVLEIETLMATSVAAFQQQQQQSYSKSAAVTPFPSCKSNTLVTPCIADTPSSKPNTPTDVQDINF